MERLVLMIILTFICGVVFNGCSSEKTKSELQYEKTELGGCNTKSASTDDSETNDDDVIITVSKKSVHVFVGHNYTCKELPFETRCETIDDVLYMYIIDTGGDYYRCKCYFTFDFIFKREGTAKPNQSYKVLLIRPTYQSGAWIEEEVTISEGVIR